MYEEIIVRKVRKATLRLLYGSTGLLLLLWFFCFNQEFLSVYKICQCCIEPVQAVIFKVFICVHGRWCKYIGLKPQLVCV